MSPLIRRAIDEALVRPWVSSAAKCRTTSCRSTPHNANSKDWVILLEASTIVGPSPDRLRIARATLERRVVKKYNIFLRARHFLVVDGYNPRHSCAVFLPAALPLRLRQEARARCRAKRSARCIAQSLEGGVAERRPWYQPADKFPNDPVISGPMQSEFDTVVVEMSSARSAAGKPARET